MHLWHKKTTWEPYVSNHTLLHSFIHSVNIHHASTLSNFSTTSCWSFKPKMRDHSCLQCVHSFVEGDLTWWGLCHEFERGTVRSPSRGLQLTQVDLGLLYRGIEGLSWRVSRSLSGAQDWDCSGRTLCLEMWRDAKMRNIKADIFGQIEKQFQFPKIGKAKPQNVGKKRSYAHRNYVEAHICHSQSPDFKHQFSYSQT